MGRIKLDLLIVPAVALFFGVAVALVIAALLGENPANVLYVLFHGAIGSPTDIGYSLYYATPLLLTGLSVAWAFQAGLFNIGADGQMMLGGVAMAVSGILARGLPWFLALPLAVGSAALVGGIWGAVAGWMKAKRGCHEVLSTILLNFIAYGMSGFFILTLFKNPDSQVPETAMVGSGFQISSLPSWISGTSPANTSLIFSLLLVLAYGFIMNQTRLGFYQRLIGHAPETGRRAGVSTSRQIILAMFISGAIAGMSAVSPVLGFAYKTREGFTSNAGFVGIAVALLGRNRPLGIIASALLFGALTKGALDLDLDTTYVSRDLAMVIQALIILGVASHAGLNSLVLRWRERRKA